MTSRERLLAASRGGEVDRKPVLAISSSAGSDALIVSDGQVGSNSGGDLMVLAQVRNPFGLALSRGIDLNAELSNDPAKGNEILNSLVEEAKAVSATALASGADGVFYELHGATASHCSPMQYGGYYLERDREVLEEIKDASLNVLYVVGDDETYIDFVSDLPAHVFAWDNRTTGFGAAYVRSLRSGAQASFDPASEISLRFEGPGTVAQSLERQLNLTTHV